MDRWYTKKELTKLLDVERESIRKPFHTDEETFTLVELGIYEVRDPDANIPHYRVARSPVMEMLQAYETEGGYPLDQLFEVRSTKALVLFFLEDADPDTSYSKNKLSKEIKIHYNSVSNNIDRLVEADIVRPVEGTRGTEYQFSDSMTTRFIYELNQQLVETVRDDET
jgi:hypothetical protein